MVNPTVLLIEPDIAVRQPLAEYLRECGYKVFEAVTTDEAVAILGQGAPAIGVVLADVAAPGRLDGFALAHWLRSSGMQAQIILAATVTKAAKAAGELCEDGPVLDKPYDHQILLDRIKSLGARRDRASDG